jgi:tRNA pseudouridine32 synthase/23S rRNA pseudouridine746 synthase
MTSSSKKVWPRRETVRAGRGAPPKETGANSPRSSPTPTRRKPDWVELGDGTGIPILYEDRSVIALDKPAWWMLVPHSWQRTTYNLQAALVSSIAAGYFWARSRNLKFLRYVHRLDAETTGVLLFGKSPGAVESYGDLFESRRMDKRYLAVVTGHPKQREWTCRLPLLADPKQIGRMQVDPRHGKEAETHFTVVRSGAETTLLEVRPRTGRTHQIRVHLAAEGHPVVGESLYGANKGPALSLSKGPIGELGSTESRPTPLKNRGGPDEGRARLRRAEAGRAQKNMETKFPLALRAVELSYLDPFSKRPVRIRADSLEFLSAFGFAEE